MRKILSAVIVCLLVLTLVACDQTPQTPQTSQTPHTSETPSQSAQAEETAISDIYLDPSRDTEERVADLLSKMTLADKAGQMVQGEQYPVTDDDMEQLGLGSVLSGGGSVPGNNNTVENWNRVLDSYQEAVLSRPLKIPYLYGIDAVHGHNTLHGAVIFPHNIGLGAANDAELTEQMGAFVAEEMKLTGIRWNFAPCVAVALDPRWGRTYESYSTDVDITTELASAYAKGQARGGVVTTAKHYVADGGTVYGTGENGYPLDRGDVQVSEELLRSVHMAPYVRLISEGVPTVMVSFSSYQGLKMHEHAYLVTDVLKGELGFKGFVISDWEGIHELDLPSYEDKVAAAVNAGVDMLMEPYLYKEAVAAIINGVETGKISQERVDDAVTRILTVKFDMGLFEDPYLDQIDIAVSELGSQQGRDIARQLVEKSQVLLKNENGVLPLKRGQKIYLVGPAADSIGVQCGGWSLTWQGSAAADLTVGTTILDAFNACADEYGLEIITDEARASEADVVVLALGERPYAEFQGDTEDLSLTGALGLAKNAEAIKKAKSLGKPVVALIVAGRHVLLNDYISDWDAVVMCYLPGTEGDGIVSPLVGRTDFTGKLPMPWYKSVNDIGKADAKLLFELGFGLSAK